MRVRTDNPAHGGAVFAIDEGKSVLVYYALPGELVEAEPRGRRGGLVFARATEILEAAGERIEPRCPHFGECGGCHWQHAAYSTQLEIKRRVVAEAWRRANLRLPPDTPVLGMVDPWRYRIRGEFEAVPSGDQLAFGFHRLRSHSTFAIQTCPIHDERIERAVFAFAQAANEHNLSGIQNLLLTVEPTGRGLLWRLRFTGQPRRTPPESFAHRVAELLPDLVLLDDSISLEFWGLAFRVRTDTFVQTNYRQMLPLYETALAMLDPSQTDHVLDLYSGIGCIGLAVARQAGKVTAIEENPHAVQLARLAARINAAPNVEFLPGRVEHALSRVRMGESDAAILDPPRAGCDPRAIAELLRVQAARIVYVSCEPATHARDLALLVQGGYRVRRAAIVDMFPQTYHVESVALLER
ncbi:MAG TPA: class I SAM-dependent RNA methyltransferase [Candidatus Dormibacteraeota bacterium]